MKIGQLAEAAGVSTSRIRFYEKHGLVPAATRLENGYRDYPEAMVSRLRTITMSKALGFTLSEIRAFLPDDPSDLIARDDVRALLQTKLSNVDQQMTELKAIRQRVCDMIAYFESPDGPSC
ncbi:MerR family transcriptional regulator [Tateyamaria sp.]|uniref:MerR family transcriptional regulator n=1 Tax=Tateyamaria sp. TaxID=1929288 RepID=UPI003B2182A6